MLWYDFEQSYIGTMYVMRFCFIKVQQQQHCRKLYQPLVKHSVGNIICMLLRHLYSIFNISCLHSSSTNAILTPTPTPSVERGINIVIVFNLTNQTSLSVRKGATNKILLNFLIYYQEQLICYGQNLCFAEESQIFLTVNHTD